MKSLEFAATFEGRSSADRKRVKRASFASRSSLPISAACVVANGVRETLSSLLGAPVLLRLFEPSIPSPQAWPAISRDARLYRTRGSVADAAVVLRAPDAIAFAAALFGESHAASTAERALSPIECEVLDRMINAIAANLTAVCGTREVLAVERVAAIGGFVTYFELLVEEPIAARIGIALSRDPAPEPRGCVEMEHLAGVRLKTLALLDAGRIAAAAVASLAVGAIVPIGRPELHRCSLTVGGRVLARGSCGVRNGRYALTVEAMHDAT
jgi:Type III flagellar switch regulator (C-ring) FliN C-term